MSLNTRIAKRYAQALFELGDESDILTPIQRDLKMILTGIEHSLEFRQFIENPAIPSLKRKEIIDELFKSRVHASTLRFLHFLESKRRLNILKDACRVFEELYLAKKGIIEVAVHTAESLNEHQLTEISRHLKTRFAKDIVTSTYIDPTLIGGIKLRIQTTVYDFSIRKQLDRFRKAVIHA